MTNPKLSAARKRSWETRRKRYGGSGGNRRRRVFHVKEPETRMKSTPKHRDVVEVA